MKKDIRIIRFSRPYVNRIYLRSIFTVFALALCALAIGQTIPEEADPGQYVTGVVRDANTKAPLGTVQIRTLNHEASAITDENGTFRIQVMSPSEVLLVEAFDYNPREVPVQGRQNLEIDLYTAAFNEMYPEIEGIAGPVRSSCNANAARETKEMGYPTFYASVDEIIQARMGGDVRSTTRSGVSGLGSNVFIRGLNSLNLNAQPLYVVDGVIWNNLYDVVSLHDGFSTNSLAFIELNDIESVSVIKDGTTIYGSKGSNGVILVKTKRGRDMATRIVVNAIGGITEKPSSLPVMNGDQFRIYLTDLLGTDDDIKAEEIEDLGFLQDDPSYLDYRKYHNRTDWDREVYRLGVTQNYNIRVHGGDEKALYAFSIGYTGNWGVVKNTDMQRLNTRTNADFFLTDKIRMGANIGFTNIDRNLLDDGVNFYTSPTYLAMIKAAFLNPYTYTTQGELSTDFEDSDDFDVGNPSAIIQNTLNTNKHYRLNIGIKPEFQLWPSVSLSTQFDYNLNKVKETYYSPIIGVAEQDIPGLGVSENVFRSQQIRNTGLFSDTRLVYSHLFNNKHRVNALAGLRYLYNYLESDFAEGHNSGSDQKRNLLNELEFKNTNGLNNEIKSISNYLNVDYSYDNHYFLTAMVAVDGSSRFGRETKGGFQLFDRSWAVFPSLNAAWLLSSEEFMTGAAFINRLKIRGGFGSSGNDALDPYGWTAYFIPVRYMDRANGLVLGNIANTEIQWETSNKLSLGVDANLFNDLLAFSADVYSNHTKDLLTLRSLPDVAGPGYYWSNGGEMSNKGFEISANVRILNSNKLKWELGASVGHYVNKIETLPEGDFTTSILGAEILSSVGNPAGVFYGYKTNGIFTNEAGAVSANLTMIDSNGTEHAFGAGDVHFADPNGDGCIDENDRQIIGDPNPDLYGSFNSHLAIGNFTIEALFTFSYGNDIYNYLRSELESGSDYINQTTAMLNRWTYEGQETMQPKVVYKDPMGNSRFSDRWIEDGSYLRLKTLSVNYKIPLHNSVIDGLDIWVAANNLWTLTNYLGRDPEVSPHYAVLYQGIDTGLIPVRRSYFLGIKLNL